MPSTGVRRIHFCASAEYSTLPIGESLSITRMRTSLPLTVDVICGGVLSTWNSTPSFASLSGASGLSTEFTGTPEPAGASGMVSLISFFSASLSSTEPFTGLCPTG